MCCYTVGIGSKCLSTALATADVERRIVVLGTQEDKNVQFYTKLYVFYAFYDQFMCFVYCILHVLRGLCTGLCMNRGFTTVRDFMYPLDGPPDTQFRWWLMKRLPK